jgi:hypothetical protein
MSVNGTKRTFQSRSAMSAFGGKADREHARYFATALGHFLRWFRFWRSYHAGLNLGPRSALKPNPAQARVLFAHALVGGFAGPLEAFFSPFPIVGGRRHRLVPSLAN